MEYRGYEYTPIKLLTRSGVLTMLARQYAFHEYKIFVLLDTYRSLKHSLDLSTILAVKDNDIFYRCHFTVNEKTHPALLCEQYSPARKN